MSTDLERSVAKASHVAPLSVNAVTKTYRVRGHGRRTVTAVDDVSFAIEPGAAVGLVGASGSGKSTLAKLITGSERPSRGTIRFGDLAVERLRSRRLRQFHSRRADGVPGSLRRAQPAAHRRVHGYASLSELPGPVRARRPAGGSTNCSKPSGSTPAGQFAAKLPHQLSGGQRQRVVIARALACDPDLVVADEPVSMLDVSLRAGVLKLLARLREERGLSLLYITHDLLSARVVTDEILVLNKGKIVERGPTKQVLQHPQDSYTVQLLDAVANPFAADAEESHPSTR